MNADEQQFGPQFRQWCQRRQLASCLRTRRIRPVPVFFDAPLWGTPPERPSALMCRVMDPTHAPVPTSVVFARFRRGSGRPGLRRYEAHRQ